MNIIESNNYKKAYKKVLKNKDKEKERLNKIITIFLEYPTLHDVMITPYKEIYYIEQKHANLKEYYTARLNKTMRLIMKPVGEYPYNTVEITDIEFIDIDNKHYGEG
jgi:plasmid maintenance system killer protein